MLFILGFECSTCCAIFSFLCSILWCLSWVFSVVRVAQSLVFCVVFCVSLFVLLSLLFLSFHCPSFFELWYAHLVNNHSLAQDFGKILWAYDTTCIYELDNTVIFLINTHMLTIIYLTTYKYIIIHTRWTRKRKDWISLSEYTEPQKKGRFFSKFAKQPF